MRTRSLVLALLALGGVILAPGIATAHDLRATVTIDTDAVRVEVGFDDDSPAEQAEVTVRDERGAVLATGRTDARGVWSCPRPAPGRYTAKVSAIGHVDEVAFEVKAPRLLFARLGDELNSATPQATPPGDEPAVYTGWRMNRALGLGIGVGGLLGLSGAYWWFRRRNTLQ